MNWVNQSIPKKDSKSLISGKPVYTQDIAPKDCLVVKLLRSPYAHARIRTIHLDKALKIEGIETILTFQDVPQKRFTIAGQSFPEPSPYDRLILDQTLRYIGDPVAIIAGLNETNVDLALKKIKVDYEILDPILDYTTAKDHPVIIHSENNWVSQVPVGADQHRNLCAHGTDQSGNVDEVFKSCAFILEQTYHTKANQQVAMETFRSYTYLDAFDRLICMTSTQIPFHVRRILSNALDLSQSRIRVIKPRIGGGFGSKQTSVSDIYPAIITLKTGKPAMMIYSRYESLIASSPRHEMQITVKIGSDTNGIIKAIDMYTLSNTGAYGDHGPTTVALSGHKSIPLYGKTDAYRFRYDVVYTNRMSSGAYRGYGATQGIFALESAIDELANLMKIDPIKIREINLVKEGQTMPAYFGETLTSCKLSDCLDTAKNFISWDEKYPFIRQKNGKIRSVGAAMAMQGSGIANVDTAAVSIKLSDHGFYNMLIGATDMGTGCDTILAQIAADCLDCPVDQIIVSGVDTDTSPYDSGSYASSTTYVTGNAVIKACSSLIEKIKNLAADLLDISKTDVDFCGQNLYSSDHTVSISLKDIATSNMAGNQEILSVTESFSGSTSPPPFMVGIAETEIDPETGGIELINFVAVIDCGTTINPSLARIQAEGGIVQGIGMALFEDIVYNTNGKVLNNSLMQYKIPSRLDIPNIHIKFEDSFEASGPFGAKSIGEIVINTPCPAIANAVYNGTHVRIRELPITSEKIYTNLNNAE